MPELISKFGVLKIEQETHEEREVVFRCPAFLPVSYFVR